MEAADGFRRRRIAVTGGLGDIGLATAVRLAQDGHEVTILDLHEQTEGARAVAERAGKQATSLQYRSADVTDDASVGAALDSIPDLDTVIANAGIVRSAPFLEITNDDFRAHLDVNLVGAFYTLRAAGRRFVREGTEGLLLATTSWVSEIPWPEIAAYTATKAGLDMLIKQAARELAPHRIRANALAPGIVLAGLAKHQLENEPQYAARANRVVPLRYFQPAEKVASGFSFLCSADADYMTGSILTIDGGASLYAFD